MYNSFKKIDEDLIDTHMPDEGNKVDKTHMLPMHHSQYDVIQSAIDDGYKIFSTIRNPEDRFYSFLRYAKRHIGFPDHRFFDYSYLNSIRNKAYLQNCIFIHGCPQHEFIYDGDRKITDKDFLCDENLFKNLSEYFDIDLQSSHHNPSEIKEYDGVQFEEFKNLYSKDIEIYEQLKNQ
jgi:hypothetical protein